MATSPQGCRHRGSAAIRRMVHHLACCGSSRTGGCGFAVQIRLLRKDSASIKQSAEQAQSGMGRINTAMSSPPMRLAALVPWFGTAVSNAQHFSSAGEELVTAAVPVAENFDPNVYRNGAVNLTALDALLAQLPQLTPAFSDAREELANVSGFSPFGGLFTQARDSGLAYVDLGDFATSKIAPQRQVILDALGSRSPLRST